MPQLPRIQALEAPFDPAIDQLLTRMTPPGAPNVLALFRTLAVNPAMAERMMPWGGYLLGAKASLTLRDREVVIDRVCARCGAEYEWGVHVAAFAGAARFTEAAVAAIADVDQAGARHLDVLPERDRLLVRLVDELHETSKVGDELWERIAAVWTPAQCIELLMLAGWYHAISYVCNGARVPLEAWQARFPKR